MQILVVQCRKWLVQSGPVFCMFLATKNTNSTLFATRLGVSTAETRLIILFYLNMDQVFQNESFNALIWERAPKNVYLSLEKLRFAVYDDVAMFSDGRQLSLNVLKAVGVQPGYYTTELCCMLNLKRKMRSSNSLSETAQTMTRARKIELPHLILHG